MRFRSEYTASGETTGFQRFLETLRSCFPGGRKTVPPPDIREDFAELPTIQRVEEALRYNIRFAEYSLSPGGGLRLMLKCGLSIAFLMSILVFLLLPLIALSVAQFAMTAASFSAAMGSLAAGLLSLILSMLLMVLAVVVFKAICSRSWGLLGTLFRKR